MTYLDYAQSGLAALLADLEQELLAAPADEVGEALRETGRARSIACQEVRALLNEAIATSEEDPAATLPRTLTRGWIGSLTFREGCGLRGATIGTPPAFLR